MPITDLQGLIEQLSSIWILDENLSVRISSRCLTLMFDVDDDTPESDDYAHIPLIDLCHDGNRIVSINVSHSAPCLTMASIPRFILSLLSQMEKHGCLTPPNVRQKLHHLLATMTLGLNYPVYGYYDETWLWGEQHEILEKFQSSTTASPVVLMRAHPERKVSKYIYDTNQNALIKQTTPISEFAKEDNVLPIP